ncbi:MAG: DPP IV N-terminal domain-containing protein [Bacteroidales bacterium]
MKKASLLFCLALILSLNVSAQKVFTIEDYNKADSLTAKFKVYNAVNSINWIKNKHFFWYQTETRKGKEIFLVNADKLKKDPAFNAEKLCLEINKAMGKNYKPFAIPYSKPEISEDLNLFRFTIDTAKWEWNRLKNVLKYDGKVEKSEPEPYWSETLDSDKGEPVKSPDGKYLAYTKNFNLYVKEISSGNESQMSYDGSEGCYYSTWIQWSPDSKKIATNRIVRSTKHYIYFVESSPVDQLQPKLHKRDYTKPGDQLPVASPCLFNVEQKKQIPVDATAYQNQYSLDVPAWRNNSRAFTFEFNQRGHQRYMVVEVDAGTGKQTILVDEKSDTFFEYSSPNKKIRYDINDGKEMIWASERDGWNHLYLFNNKGDVINQITKGEWVVRGVEYIDEQKREVIFKASGMNKGEDPYLIHYYTVNFDGSGMKELTPEEANHTASFSSDHNYFVDNFSRIDMPNSVVLRSKADGKILMELEKVDMADLQKLNWQTPEVFSAKGRDGTTDIWGMIYRPTNFDPQKQYPIIEYIYAGPHDSFVPKTFRANYSWFSSLAELGFIVVQIDGMGTSNRSKAFHDVCWRNLKDAGFPDRILWMKAAAKKYPYMDITRVGIFGGSAGGQSSTAALLYHPEFYKAAVSSCGCHDNRMDKIWWNEQWMGYPIGPWYAENSNVDNAHLLKGKLMLLVGEMDDNVDPATTMQVCNALIKANKEFELVVLPGMNHTGGGQFGERKRRDFFIRNLQNATTPDWNNN